MKLRSILSVLVLLGMSAPGMAQIQTQLPVQQPKLTLTWLASLTMSPTSVAAGTDVTGTVKLLRAAISDLSIGLGLSGATYVEGNILAADGALMTGLIKIPAGSSQGTFVIKTSKPTSTTGSKTFTVTASYGTEQLSTTFTITQPLIQKSR